MSAATLLWGLRRDPTMAVVEQQLRRRAAPVYFVDQRGVLATTVDLQAGPQVGGYVCVAGDQLDVRQLGAMYLRPHDGTKVAAVRARPPGSAHYEHARAVDGALAALADLTPALVVNRPSASVSNGSKPYQLMLIAQAGFAVPRTLVTNDPGAVLAFAERRDVVVKSVSGIRSRVRRVTAADLSRLAQVTACPTQFQQWVPGTDVRVHVVGADLFATSIESDADDYRYATQQGHERARLAATSLPDDVAQRCLNLSAALGLVVAGIDLRRSPDGTWYCFEANPSPAFGYYEHWTGQPIAAAVAGLLAAATVCAGRTV